MLRAGSTGAMVERLAKYWRRPAVDSKAETGMIVQSSLCTLCVLCVSVVN